MEGIFDFGMAGIRKGLRLTGLQEIHQQNKKPPPKTAKKLAKWPQVIMDDPKSEDSVWINPLNSPNFEGDILLVNCACARNISRTFPRIHRRNHQLLNKKRKYRKYPQMQTVRTPNTRKRQILPQQSPNYVHFYNRNPPSPV